MAAKTITVPASRSEIIEELRQFDMPTYGSDQEVSERLRIAETVYQMGDAIPDWLERTPTTKFCLVAVAEDDEWLQEIDLSYDEYESAKLHVATLRGYKLPEEPEGAAPTDSIASPPARKHRATTKRKAADGDD